MATGGGPFEEGMNDQDLPSWSNESFDDRLNNTDWGGQQKKANRSSEKNKKKFGGEGETRLTNDISPESSPGMGRRKTRTLLSFPHTRYMTQMSVPEQAELERLKQRINFSDLDQRSIGSDSQGRATAANNKRQLNETRKPFNFLPLQINTNKGKDAATSPQKKETGGSSQCKELFASALSKDFLQNYQVSVQEDGRGEPAMDSSQIVSRLVQIRDYIAKASSMRDDLVEKNERSANVERLSHLIDHLKEQEKSYLKFLQKMLARENEEEDVRTIDSAVGSGSVAESTSLNIDVQSEASDTTARDPQQEAKEELENLKKQHDLLTRMLQQQEQLKALQGRQAALLALQHKAEQAIAVMDDSVVTETTGSISGVSLTSELNEELNELIQRFHNQLHESQTQPVPDNRRQAESLSLTREISQSRNSSMSQHLSDEKAQLFSKMRMLQGKKQKMDKLLGELHTLRDEHLNNSSFLPVSPVSGAPQRSIDQRSTTSAASAPTGIATVVNGESNSLASSAPYPPDSIASQNESEEDDNLNPTEKLQKLNEVRKRLNELRELVHYYEQTSDMMTDAVNENTKEEDTGESECDSEHENSQPVTNIRNPQGISSWGEINSNSNIQCGTTNRDGRHLNTDCEINNRSAANLRTLNMSSTLDCRNRDNDKDIDDISQGGDDEVEEDRASEVSLSSCRSSVADAGDAEFEQKINRLIAAKQKLKQLQNLVAMVQDDETEPEATTADISNAGDFFLAEVEEAKQQPNNIRASTNKLQQDVRLNEKAREKFYEAKLQQQQRELKQLQEERRKLIEIQEKIQALQKACPDLQLSASLGNCQANRPASPATSTPAVESSTAGNPILEPEESVTVDNELWSEMRRHEILREELRQRRKQLEALMAEHQRRRDLAETTSTVAASVKSDGSETQCTPQQSRMEKTVATWGGSTQCVLDEEDGDGYLSDGLVQAEEEEEEQESSSNDNFSMYPHNNDQSTYCVTENKDRWKNRRPLSADGNYRPLAKTRQQQNISMRRQENLKWMSELSYVEEKEQWQEQINQLKKQLEFSVRICQTLMQDQQTLSCLLQTLLTGPYSVMPSNVASPQVHLIMHQLNQCYTQLTWQQNNVQRLKQMLNDLMYQQEQQQQEKPQRKERGSSAPPPPSPTVFCPFSFPPQPMNLFNIPGFTNFSSFAPGMNFNPMFPSGFGDFAHNVTPHNSEQPQQQPLDHTSGKTEYMAFPKPFESSSSVGAEKQRSQRQPEEEMENRAVWLDDSQEGRKEKQPFLKAGFAVSVQNMASGNHKSQSDTSRRRREFDEESLESFSSMPDPVDPTTVTKTFKSRKASAQASLASKDKTPKSKNKRRSSSQLKSRVKNTGYESASISSTWEPCKSNRSRRSVHSEEAVQAKVFSKKNQEQLEKIIKYSRSTEMSSAHARRILQQSNRNACIEAPETGSDLSMFEALRDTIYSEVATLISQNESRPHFLIELFHELQLLNTDYLRQRALYALQDIVTRHISENNEKGECTKSLNSATWMASNSELTPSESLATTDDETFEKNFDTGASRDCEQNDADNGSTMSTSSNFEPFATDDLGNTVIHLDQALARMREYERMKTEAESTLDSEGCCSNLQSASAVKLEGQSTGESPCVPQPSEVSSVPCPRIDTQQLDRQIKAIMKEVIPFLKEHMDEVCSSQLLTSVRRMVLTLTQQNDESKEFVKFFHKQLGGILQDSLAKFAGRKLKDCGEDLLVEISEVLFNELAFFKLMKDLDSNSITVKQRCKSKMEAAGVIQPYDKEAKRVLEVGVRSSAEDIDEDKDKDETETVKPTQESEIYNDGEVPQSMRSDASDQEEDEESEGCPVSISLSKAETQALTNYGSGEDENEDDEIEFEEGPVDVQTSLQASNDTTVENEQGQISTDESDKPNEYEILSSKQKSISSKDEQDVPAVLPHYLNMLENKKLLTVSAPESVSATKVSATEEPSPSLLVNEIQISETMCIETKSLTGSPESSMAGSPDTESPVLVTEYEAGSGNISQKSDEDDFVRVEDLPLKLTIYSEADLMNKMVAEAQTNTLSDAILDGDGMQSEELAGDSQTLKEPETAGAQSA
ncbi:pericentriolar material 1 protein isoform X8 [Chelonia mydas]|uniref:pericentriolar material 1 protein isoform X8 n=1 Tax=Chelonia mydas TaxID=8469 RepID=UPI0018A1B7CE|nr:pericentriolar material 1 protein isoform X8 [Chelonia mydas]XP_043402063.1 pericentriolar material 1 protein isoform X8 [Chelonia mydas]XP_043402064.1 pericentriolar material 1 protein isoform X8 [Chelonia mydas]XP_043402065.1 pericentriolar material 1 protein isoform X8 [Chelonia mydas]